MPILRSSAPVETPGQADSTMKAVCLVSSILAKTTITSAKPALLIHCFAPLRM